MSPAFEHHLKYTASTFIEPDLSFDKFEIHNVINHHIINNSKYPFGLLAGIDNKQSTLRDVITWNEIGSGIITVINQLFQNRDIFLNPNPIIIGIIVSQDYLSYFTVILACMRIGLIPFLISPKCSPTQISHLLEGSGCKYVYVPFNRNLKNDGLVKISTIEKSNRKQIEEVEKILLNQYNQKINFLEFPNSFKLFPRLINNLEYEYDSNIIQTINQYPIKIKSKSLPIILLHSSGTTNLSKIVPLNRLTFHALLTAGRNTNFLWKNQLIAGMCLPPFHGMGLHLTLDHILSNGSLSSFFRPEIDQNGNFFIKQSDPLNVLNAMKSLGCTVAIFSPYTLTEYSYDLESIEFLKSMERVGFGGGPLSGEIGSKLFQQGVKLSTVYGATEIGAIATCLPEPSLGPNWEYFEISPQITAELIPQGDEVYELVILSSDRHRCSIKFEDDFSPQEYYTKDLLMKHPKLPIYKLIGRKDEQIILSNSEKTNPAPLECILRSNPVIKSAMVFGNGKPLNGVLIEPEEGYIFDKNNNMSMEQYMKLIWPSIELINKEVPKHSKLIKELIIIINPYLKPLPKTIKGTIIRKKALEIFSKEIEETYLKYETGINVKDFLNVLKFSEKPILNEIKDIIEVISGRSLIEDQDLFLQGCDR
ncbi:hypothetical protein CROQUDRAFT_38300 [Cronartium quercuum f. sp. fusiforme G11]|uniref:AMP-dependent synthetase/ligase domain-containing protein n=1 Tax=Cronartium quercuum f. sp. fusiforme G11 TaxID=708437 RepID=A0A9P6NVY6_9BASI|nr:hypothetical protein CROQUDRAFT_38300 [Cronartium quercuum f. sp. fusiforme G11]